MFKTLIGSQLHSEATAIPLVVRLLCLLPAALLAAALLSTGGVA